MTTFKYNGVDMSKYFKALEVIRPIGNSRTVSTDNTPKIGVNIQATDIGPKIIKVRIAILAKPFAEAERLKHELAGILNVDKPKKMEFGDEPDKYYLGMVQGEITPERLARWSLRGEIEFLIPDGVAHSTSYKQFDSPVVSSDRVTFNLMNNGNVNAYPIITVKHHAENGYIGAVNASGAFELGNREEADMETVKQSELLFDYRDNKITTGLNTATRNVAVLNDAAQRLTGTVGTVNVWGRPHLFLNNRGAISQNDHLAGSLTWNIPQDSTGARGSLNDYIWWRQIFWAGAVNQFGFIKLTVSDEQGRFLYGVETFKRSNGVASEYNFLASNGRGGFNMIKRWNFNATHEDKDNPFNHTRGWSDLKRNDDRVTVYWWGSYNTFIIPEIKGRKSAKIHVAFGAVGNRPQVHHMYLDSIMYCKDFVSVTKDIPNRFHIGSNVVINSEDDTVYVDGIAKIGEVVDGSRWLAIPPGKSTLEVYVSSFVRNKPTVKIEFEERWL